MKFQKILLTGGSRGIGRALLDLFLEDGSEVHVISRKFEDKTSSVQSPSKEILPANSFSNFLRVFRYFGLVAGPTK